MMKRFLYWIIPIFIVACTSGGMYQSQPCDSLQGQARNDCMRYLPAYSRSAEKKEAGKWLPTQEGYERALEAIDNATERMIDVLFY